MNCSDQPIHRGQFLQSSSPTKVSKLVFLILFLNAPSEIAFLISFVSFDQRNGPAYLRVCLSYFIYLSAKIIKLLAYRGNFFADL